MSHSHEQFYAAMLARDYRFDGKFFVGVKTTGIYCRPICPAKPKSGNVEFFSSSHEAENAGYRPCLRCRPEAAPLSPAWYGKSAIVQRSLRAIIDSGLDGLSEERFAERFGVTARHLRRLFVQEIGKTPRQFYQEQRLNLSRSMIVETVLPITEIAYGAGFHSLRRFNDAFKKRFSRAPSEIRKMGVANPKGSPFTTLKLSYRPPFNWKSIIQYLKRHQIDHIEEIGAEKYIRYFPTQKGMGRVLVENCEERSCLIAQFDQFDCGQLYGLIQSIRRVFDLDADPLSVSTKFEHSNLLRRLDREAPGGRAPGCWNGFETAVAIILGQLVSLEQGQRLVRQLVENYGETRQWQGKDVCTFPAAEKLAACDFAHVTTTGKRKETLRILSQKVAVGEISLNPHQDAGKLKEQLLAIPGIGGWTAEYIGMRCLSDPDSCPQTDLILKRVQTAEPGLDLEQIRPWRAYAAYLLW
ncbi:MAG: Ada metal-binding domain-containing protein, partial [Syntrophales bacterium]|nr:Ada metal-binding domain-containing protein [Syntrophales bacterium]